MLWLPEVWAVGRRGVWASLLRFIPILFRILAPGFVGDAAQWLGRLIRQSNLAKNVGEKNPSLLFSIRLFPCYISPLGSINILISVLKCWQMKMDHASAAWGDGSAEDCSVLSRHWGWWHMDCSEISLSWRGEQTLFLFITWLGAGGTREKIK